MFELWYWIAAAADGWTTERGLDRGAREANPIGRYLIQKLGDRGILVTKVLGFAVLWWIDMPVFWWAAIVLQFVVAALNLRLVLKLKERG